MFALSCMAFESLRPAWHKRSTNAFVRTRHCRRPIGCLPSHQPIAREHRHSWPCRCIWQPCGLSFAATRLAFFLAFGKMFLRRHQDIVETKGRPRVTSLTCSAAATSRLQSQSTWATSLRVEPQSMVAWQIHIHHQSVDCAGVCKLATQNSVNFVLFYSFCCWCGFIFT